MESRRARARAAFIYDFGKLGKKIGRKTATTTHDREADVPHDNSVVCVFLWVCVSSAFLNLSYFLVPVLFMSYVFFFKILILIS